MGAHTYIHVLILVNLCYQKGIKCVARYSHVGFSIMSNSIKERLYWLPSGIITHKTQYIRSTIDI